MERERKHGSKQFCESWNYGRTFLKKEVIRLTTGVWKGEQNPVFCSGPTPDNANLRYEEYGKYDPDDSEHRNASISPALRGNMSSFPKGNRLQRLLPIRSSRDPLVVGEKAAPVDPHGVWPLRLVSRHFPKNLSTASQTTETHRSCGRPLVSHDLGQAVWPPVSVELPMLRRFLLVSRGVYRQRNWRFLRPIFLILFVAPPRIFSVFPNRTDSAQPNEQKFHGMR